MNAMGNSESTTLGRFWLPQAGESTSIPGVIEFNREGASVRLEGSLTSHGLLADAVVLARLQGPYEKATLFNCFGSATLRDGVAISSIVDSTCVALGYLNQELSGHTIQFRLPGSETWFHDQCFDVDFGSTMSDVVVRFKAYESYRYRLSDKFHLDRFYSATVPMGSWGMERFETKRPMAYRIFSSSKLAFDQLWEEMYRFRRLLEFFSQHRMPHEALALFVDNELPSGKPDVEIRHSTTTRIAPNKFEWDNQLVTYHALGDRLPALLQQWFTVHRANPEPFDRYFAAFDRDGKDIVLHFLWNAAALEELHKIRTSRDGFSLLDRLKETCRRWSAAFETPPDDAVLSHIKNTRHYYAHAAGDLRNRAAKDWVLLRYGYFLAALSNLEILSMLGFTDKEVVNTAQTYWMRESLALKLFPSSAM